jgi:hypothetical protein
MNVSSSPSAACNLVFPNADVSVVSGTYTIGGQTITGGLETITAVSPLFAVSTSLASSDASSYVGFVYNDMFTLVHQASDTASPSGGSKPNAAGRATGLGEVATVCLAIAFGALIAVR